MSAIKEVVGMGLSALAFGFIMVGALLGDTTMMGLALPALALALVVPK